MAEYISLASSTGSINKRFYATEMGRTLKRAETTEELTGGKLSVSKGRGRDHYTYTLFVAHTPDDSNFGSLEDLRRLFRLNNPSGSPSDVITLTKHDDTVLQCRMLGDMPEKPETVLIETAGSWYALDIELVDITVRQFELDTAADSMFVAFL